MSARIEYAPGEAWCIAAGRVVLVCERQFAWSASCAAVGAVVPLKHVVLPGPV